MQALSRLCKNGLIKRYGRGIYFHPRKTILGEAPPPTLELVRLLARQKRVVLAGLSAYNRLGLTTQMPVKEIIATNATIDNPKIEIVHRDLSRYRDAPDEVIMLLDALGHLDAIPDTTPTEVLSGISPEQQRAWNLG